MSSHRVAAPRPERTKVGERRRPAGFTLIEVMVGAALGSIVFAAGIAGVVSLQKSYTATEQYARSQADQMRVVDYLSRDLRRCTKIEPDADEQGVTLTLPAYYSYVAGDPTRSNPLPNVPVVSEDRETVTYRADGPGAGSPKAEYRFDAEKHELSRRETFTDGSNGGFQIIASDLTAFPVILSNNAAELGEVRVKVSFHPTYQTLATPSTNVITLHNLTFRRNR